MSRSYNETRVPPRYRRASRRSSWKERRYQWFGQKRADFHADRDMAEARRILRETE